jgi:hypothetical protein
LVGNPEENRPLGRPRRRWGANLRISLKEILWEGEDWIYLAEDTEQWMAVLNTVMKFLFS